MRPLFGVTLIPAGDWRLASSSPRQWNLIFAVRREHHVPTQHRPHTDNRIDAADLVERTPTAPEISESAIRAIFYVISMIAVPILAYIFTWVLFVLAIPAIWLATVAARRMDPLRIGYLFYVHWTLPQAEKGFRAQYASAGPTTTAKGIVAGNWVCLRRDYEQVCRNFRALNGRSSPPPPAHYKLVVSTFPLDGRNQVVAFSDGTSVTWNSASAVLLMDYSEFNTLSGYSNDQDILDAAKALVDIIRFLYEAPRPVTVQSTIELLGTENESNTIRALTVADWWKFVSCIPTDDSEDIQIDYDPNRLLIQLTRAGQHWHLASREISSELRKERKSVRNDRGDQPSIHIGTFSGILNYAGRNVSGSHTAKISPTPPTDDEVLSWLRTLLGLPEVPWSNSDLTDIRRTMEKAIELRDPRISGLKQAVVKLGNICGQIAIGIASNGAYQLLLQYFK